LVWALYELSEHPEIQSRLRAEIHSILGKKFDAAHPPTYDQIEQMRYLNNVCREVLRVDPPGLQPQFAVVTNFEVPITARQAIADDEFEGIKIPKASLIHFPALVINMNIEFWGEDAESFRPERWEKLKDVPNTQFITFQHGTPIPLLSRHFRFRFDLLFVSLCFPVGGADSIEVSVHVSDENSRN